MRELLPLFNKPSRYLGSEWGAVTKDPAQTTVRVALAFPDLYEVGMSYLGQKILYSQINSREQWWAERVFSPSQDVGDILKEQGAPLCTLESDTPLGKVDVIAFHVTHEMCFTNVLYMLELAGIPLRAEDRDDSHPLIMAGGGCAFNIEPLAPFVDAMILGDGEAGLPPVLTVLEEAIARGASRLSRLEEISVLPGVYVPEFFEAVAGQAPRPLRKGYERVAKAIVEDLADAPSPLVHVLPFSQAVHDRLSVEIARGCTRGCRFCHAGVVYRPVRERSPEDLQRIIEQGLEEAGYDEMSFMSLSTGDYSALDALFSSSWDRCAAEQVSISLPSLRVGSISDRIMGLMSKIRRTGVTLAPEAGSQRLRDVINKGITEEALMEHVGKLFANGWQQVKLYFMIGLPTETEEDLRAIFELAQKVADQAPPKTRRLQVTASVSPFVPKPHTPFQWVPQISLEQIHERVNFMRELFATDKRLKLRWHEPEMSWFEGLFSRGDRSLADVVEHAYRNGALYDSWIDHFRPDVWREAFAACAIDTDALLAGRDMDASLPWDHLDPGVSKEFLATEYRRALEGRLTADCRYDACRSCGVCNKEGRTSRLDPEGRRRIEPLVCLEERDQVQPAQPLPADTVPEPERPYNKPPELREDLTCKDGHFRIWFSKKGPAAYLSTLELQTIFFRALRRADVKPTFSKGFHPLPLISFGQALPVGVESEEEWFNVFTRETYSAGEIARRLEGELPKGMQVLRVEPLTMGKKQPHPVREVFNLQYAGPQSGWTAWRVRWEEFIDSSEYLFTRETRKGIREIDARSFVQSAEFLTETALQLVFDWSERYVSPLALVTAVDSELPATQWRLVKQKQLFE